MIGAAGTAPQTLSPGWLAFAAVDPGDPVERRGIHRGTTPSGSTGSLTRPARAGESRGPRREPDRSPHPVEAFSMSRPSELARWVGLMPLAFACLGFFATHRPAGADEGPAPGLPGIHPRAGPGPASRRPGPGLPGRLARSGRGGAPGAPRGLGGFPAEACPLEPRAFGTLDREGYRVEKLAFQTRPGVWMTANAYVPGTPGKHPAILAVHGHWRGRSRTPSSSPDVSGRRSSGSSSWPSTRSAPASAGSAGVGEYHGEMTAATLLPVGLPLSGLQVYENRRAVDYLRTRPEVDGDRIGITGASGGGNQSMYAGALDERLRASCRSARSGTTRRISGPAAACASSSPGRSGSPRNGASSAWSPPAG